ncbi:MAG: nucleotide-binding protein [Telluria sp.]
MQMHNTVHFILQGKGGIGKTLVSTILAQWLQQKDAPLRCYDTDQENATFLRYKALNVKHIPVMTENRIIDPKRFDALMIDMLEEDCNAVVDNGANTFSPLMSYLLENDCFDLLKESGRKVYIHSIVGGGDTLHDTATGFVSTAKSTDVPLVLWENEHFGPLASASGKVFTESATYADNAARVVGRVVLSQRNADTFGADIKKMNTARMTAEEVKGSDKFNVMEKQRIKVVFRDLFEQLEHVNW